MKSCPGCRALYPVESKFCFVDGSVLVMNEDPRIGTTIAGRYLVEERIGQGGMANVYRAHHKLVDRMCAIKIMNPALARDVVVRERFRREAKSAHALAHPNIIEIYDQGDTDDGTSYIVMELLAGRTLAADVEGGAIPAARAVPLAVQVARGIARAHDLGVVHRDLKPENIYLVPDGDGDDLVKLLDFGIARSRSDSRLTNQGELFGTPQYMAPERITAGEAGPSVDLYALGIILFEMLTGRVPFEGRDPTQTLLRHVKDEVPAPRSIAPAIPEPLEALVLALLEKDPKDRPVDAHRVESLLVEVSDKLGYVVPPAPEEQTLVKGPRGAKTRPAIHVHQWARRVYVFEEMLKRAFGQQAPREADRVLGELKSNLEKVTALRSSAVKEQRELEAIDERGREGRQRFGFAVQALGVDASKVKDELSKLRARLPMAEAENERLAQEYRAAHEELVTWEGRAGFQDPHRELARAHGECARIVEAWIGARQTEKQIRHDLEEKEKASADLEYQIQELRTALGHREEAVENEHVATEKRLIDLNQQAERLEVALVKLATSFCEPLRSKPELGPLFRELESEAAA